MFGWISWFTRCPIKSVHPNFQNSFTIGHRTEFSLLIYLHYLVCQLFFALSDDRHLQTKVVKYLRINKMVFTCEEKVVRTMETIRYLEQVTPHPFHQIDGHQTALTSTRWTTRSGVLSTNVFISRVFMMSVNWITEAAFVGHLARHGTRCLLLKVPLTNGGIVCELMCRLKADISSKQCGN
jgi:hypothetical protein